MSPAPKLADGWTFDPHKATEWEQRAQILPHCDYAFDDVVEWLRGYLGERGLQRGDWLELPGSVGVFGIADGEPWKFADIEPSELAEMLADARTKHLAAELEKAEKEPKSRIRSYREFMQQPDLAFRMA